MRARCRVQFRMTDEEWAALTERCHAGETPTQCALRILRFVLLAQP